MGMAMGKTSALSVFHMAHGADRQGKEGKDFLASPPCKRRELQTQNNNNS